MLSLDPHKLVVLCAKCVDISYDPRISQVVECIIDNDLARAAGVEDVQVGILDTGATEVGGRKCTSVEGSCIDQLILASSPLVDNPVIS